MDKAPCTQTAAIFITCLLYTSLYNLAHWSYWLSSAANYLLGGIVSFFLNKYFTFRKREWSWGQAVRFAVNVAACWLLAYGLAKPLVLQLLAGRSLWLQENAAMLVGMCRCV